jgi:hypothetical protein
LSARLGYSPAPIKGDTHVNYLLRLAYAHGIETLPQFMKIIEMTKPKLTRWYEWKPEQKLNLVIALSNVCGRDMTDELNSLTTIDRFSWLNNTSRVFKRILVDFPRICPQCMVDSEVLDWRWSLGTVARCYTHKFCLLDTCPSCQEAYEWHSDLLKCCPKCKVTWSDLPAASISPTLRYGIEKATWPSINGAITYPRYLSMLCAAIAAMARPFDIASPSISTMPYSKNHSLLVLQAISMLHRKTYPDWVKEIASNREPAFTNEPSPIDVFNKHVGYNDLEKNNRRLPKYSILERNSYLNKNRLVDITELSPNRGRYHINLFNLATILGLSVADLNSLTSTGLIPCVANSDTVENRLYNTLDVAKLLNKHMSKTLEGETIIINADEQLLVENHLHYGDMLHSIWTGVIDGTMTHALTLESMVVSKPQFMALLKLEPCQGNRNNIKQLINSHQT